MALPMLIVILKHPTAQTGGYVMIVKEGIFEMNVGNVGW